jgi:hypothetical protein
MAANNTSKGGCLIGLLAFIALIVFFCGWILHWTKDSTPSFSPSIDSSSIALKGVPGQKVHFSLNGSSIQANWASQKGLTLELSNATGFDRTFTVTPSQPDTWGDTIACTESCTMMGYSIDTSFTVPAVPPGETLTGSLTGDVYSPQNAQDPGGFENVSKDLNIPVSVQVVASFPRTNVAWGLYALIALGVFIASFAWFASKNPRK